jgi:hypothetical protein
MGAHQLVERSNVSTEVARDEIGVGLGPVGHSRGTVMVGRPSVGQPRYAGPDTHTQTTLNGISDRVMVSARRNTQYARLGDHLVARSVVLRIAYRVSLPTREATNHARD